MWLLFREWLPRNGDDDEGEGENEEGGGEEVGEISILLPPILMFTRPRGKGRAFNNDDDDEGDDVDEVIELVAVAVAADNEAAVLCCSVILITLVCKCAANPLRNVYAFIQTLFLIFSGMLQVSLPYFIALNVARSCTVCVYEEEGSDEKPTAKASPSSHGTLDQSGARGYSTT